MVAWQPMQLALEVSSVTFSRMVSEGSKCSSLNSTACGGGLSIRPMTLRVRKTPRWMGEVVFV